MRKAVSSIVAIAAVLMAAATTSHAQNELTLGVSEGTSGGLDHGRVIAKYGGLADVIGRALKRKVNVVFAREFAALDEGMRSGRFDLVFARPSDYPARAVRDHGYQFVASARPDGHCLIITAKGSSLQTLAQAKGARWVLPEQVSYMSKFCAAELRDRGILVSGEKVQYVREQAAVPFFLDNKFADVARSPPIQARPKHWKRPDIACCTRAWRNLTFRWWPASASRRSRFVRSRPSSARCRNPTPDARCSRPWAFNRSTPRRASA